MKKNKNDPGILDNCYQKVFKYSVQLALKFEWQIVATTLVAIGLRIYKTVLKDDEYEGMCDSIKESMKDVKPYEDKKTLH